MTDFGHLIEALASHDVRYIIVGGFAATAHGSAFLTVDLETLIRLKRAAGRPKDLERIAELEALRTERDR